VIFVISGSYTETQKHRNTETQKHRNTETQKHRNTETQLKQKLIHFATQFTPKFQKTLKSLIIISTIKQFFSPKAHFIGQAALFNTNQTKSTFLGGINE
jgi:hypothetical protein